MKKIFLLVVLFLQNVAFAKTPSGWQIGGKIHFEENSRTDYIGLKEINSITKTILKSMINVQSDSCSSNAKILLKEEDNKIKMTHYEERGGPGIGEEMHATLLYTKSRGFTNSETLKQTCGVLFENCKVPPTIETVAKEYGKIIKPDWKFKISNIVFIENKKESFSAIFAKLLFDEHKNIYKNDKPISAMLHLTLVVNPGNSILSNQQIKDQLIEKLNQALKSKMIKIATKNGVADLEFGVSGEPWRIRAEERIDLK